MKKFFEKLVLKRVVFAVLMLQLFYIAHINAAQKDNLQLEIGAGKPAVSPNIAVVNEEVAVNFKVWVIDTVTKKEVTPLNVKQYKYKLECPSGTIIDTVPTMTITTDEHAAILTDTKLHPDIKQFAEFATKGKFKSTLNVGIVFNDNSSLSKSFSIEIEITDATVTVYAKKPDKVVPRKNSQGKSIMCYVWKDDPDYDFAGHSFWSCQIDTRSPSYTDDEKDLSGEKYGLYPKDLTLLNLLSVIPGEIKFDYGHEYSASKTYSITIEKAKNLINKTIEKKKLATIKYCFLNNLADNCTSLSVKMCNVEAGCSSPDGIGRIGFVTSETAPLLFGIDISVCNPYSHAVQLESSD
jgi:hypothetical protein